MFFLFCPHPSTRNSKEIFVSHFLFHPIYLTSQRLTQQITFSCLNFSLRMCNSLWADRLALAECLRSHKKSHATHATVCFSCMPLSGTAEYSPLPVIKQAHHSIPKTRRVLFGSLTSKGSAIVTYPQQGHCNCYDSKGVHHFIPQRKTDT